jgi:acetyltransferase-like isoleucine patch superfamily enzyme
VQAVTQYNQRYFSPEIIFEDGVSVQQNLHLTCADQIVIGKNTAIAANVSITDIHHPYDDISIPIESQDIHVSRVRIGKDSKIYNNAVILPGVIIGEHVTIGANSVVITNLPDYCVAVGAPARIVKRYSFEKNQWLSTNPDGSFKERDGGGSNEENTNCAKKFDN